MYAHKHACSNDFIFASNAVRVLPHGGVFWVFLPLNKTHVESESEVCHTTGGQSQGRASGASRAVSFDVFSLARLKLRRVTSLSETPTTQSIIV